MADVIDLETVAKFSIGEAVRVRATGEILWVVCKQAWRDGDSVRINYEAAATLHNSDRHRYAEADLDVAIKNGMADVQTAACRECGYLKPIGASCFDCRDKVEQT